MSNLNSFVHNMEDLLALCGRSIVVPDMIALEVNRILSILNDHNLEGKYIVTGCEALSVLASGFLRSGYDSFIINYTLRTGINHLTSGFGSKDELIKYCEFCVEYGEENLRAIENTLLKQLELENGMTKDEIFALNIRRLKRNDIITVQDQITNYIKLSLLVNSLKDFFKEYYKGLN